MSLPEDSVDGATGIGSGTRRKMILTIDDAKTDGQKKSVIDTSKSFLSNPILFLIFACIETPVSEASPFPSPPADNPSPTR